MLRNSFKRGGVQRVRGRGPAKFGKAPAPREELKVSAKVTSPDGFLLQYRTDCANDVMV